MKALSQEFPVKDCCEFFDLPRSTYYRQTTAKPADDGLRPAIQAVADKFTFYGSRRVTGQLRLSPYAMRVGRNRVRRLMKEIKLLQPRRRRRSTTNSQHGYQRYPNLVKGLKPLRPEQIWAADITYLQLPWGDVYLAIVMDIYTRAIRGWSLSSTQTQQLTLDALNMALDRHGAPDIHHSDQGGQYAATKYVELLEGKGTQISMASTGKPQENGYAERVIRTFKEEEVYPNEYLSMADARRKLGRFIGWVYEHERIHSALGYNTPARFEAEWRKNRTP